MVETVRNGIILIDKPVFHRVVPDFCSMAARFCSRKYCTWLNGSQKLFLWCLTSIHRNTAQYRGPHSTVLTYSSASKFDVIL